MTQANVELLTALEAAGAPKEEARAAAASVAPASALAALATRGDLEAGLARQEAARAAMESRMSWRLVGGIGIVVTVVGVAAGVIVAALS